MLISIRHHLNLVYRAPHALRTLIQHMGIDHCGLYILVPEQFLYESNIVADLDQTSCKGMRFFEAPRRMALGLAN
jgi:hypothetical protein